MRILHLTLIISLCLVVPLHADSVDNSIAMKFYPAALDEQRNATHAAGRTPHRIASTLRVDLAKSGNADYLAIAYSNGTTGKFRVVKGATPETAVLLAEDQDALFGGDGVPVIEAVDVDNDGVPELAIEFVRESWLFKWTNGRKDVERDGAQNGGCHFAGRDPGRHVRDPGAVTLRESLPPASRRYRPRECSWLVRRNESRAQPRYKRQLSRHCPSRMQKEATEGVSAALSDV